MKFLVVIIMKHIEPGTTWSYMIGAFISLIIFCYLIYSLVRPEKF